MRFLFTVASYYPEIGGVQMVTQNTAEELVRQGHLVTVLISSRNSIHESVQLNGVKLIYYNLYTNKDRIIGDKDAYVRYLLDLCENYDVLVNVSVHSALTDVVLPHIQEVKCKTVLYLHGIYEFGWSAKDKSSILRIISKIYYNSRRRLFYSRLFKYAKNYDLVVHLSENDDSMRYMKCHGITQNLVVYNSADRSFFDPPMTINEENYFLQVANYAEHKNQEFSLRAFYQSDCPGLAMIFIGSRKTDYLDKLVKINDSLKAKYGERNVRFLTDISRDRTIEYFKHAKVIILSSRVEKFPMVLVEGMACGVPFISTDCGTVGDMPGGIIVDSIKDMSVRMSELASDSVLRRELGEKGKTYSISFFSLEENVKRLVDRIQL